MQGNWMGRLQGLDAHMWVQVQRVFLEMQSSTADTENKIPAALSPSPSCSLPPPSSPHPLLRAHILERLPQQRVEGLGGAAGGGGVGGYRKGGHPQQALH